MITICQWQTCWSNGHLFRNFSGKIYFSLRETIKLITSAFSKRFSVKAGKAEDLLRSAVT